MPFRKQGRLVRPFLWLRCAMPRAVEIRSCNLRPAAFAALRRLMTQQALPMLQPWGVNVVACPREAILALIDNYTSVVLMLDDDAVDAVRRQL